MTKPNQFVKNLKNINKSINSLLERNLNKLKFDNLKIIASNNKIILTVVALFILFISYNKAKYIKYVISVIIFSTILIFISGERAAFIISFITLTLISILLSLFGLF